MMCHDKMKRPETCMRENSCWYFFVSWIGLKLGTGIKMSPEEKKTKNSFIWFYFVRNGRCFDDGGVYEKLSEAQHRRAEPPAFAGKAPHCERGKELNSDSALLVDHVSHHGLNRRERSPTECSMMPSRG